MKDDFIKAKPLMTRNDWEKLMNMSEEEIEGNARNDSDNPPFSIRSGSIREIVCPDGIIIHSVAVEQEIDVWLKKHDLQVDKVAATLLKQFVEAQMQADKAEKK